MLVATVWSISYLPTNDGPEGVFAAHVLNHYDDPASAVLRAQLVPTWQFAARGFTLVFGPLERLLGWHDALQVSVALIVLANAWAYLAFVIAIEPRRRALAFLGFPMALSWSLYMGFFAFCIGSAAGMGTLAFVVKRDPRTAARWSLVALLLLVQSVLHVFSAAVTGLLVVGVTLARASREERAARLGTLALIGVPAGCVLAAADMTRAPGHLALAAGVVFRPVRETLALIPRLLLPGPALRALVATGLLCVAVVVGVRAARRAGGMARGVGLLAVTLLGLALAGPRDLPGWQLMSPRFLPTGALLMLALVPLERLTRPGRLAVSLWLFACAVTSLGVSRTFHGTLAAGCSEVIDALSAPISRKGLVLPVSLEPACGVTADLQTSQVPYLANLHHIGALFAVADGGSTPYLFAGSASAHAFKIRPNGMPVPPVPDPEHFWPIFDGAEFRTQNGPRQRVLDELAVLGTFYEAVVVTGARAADFETWDARGYVTDWRRGSVLLAHFDACTLDVTLPASDPPPAEMDVGVGARMLLTGVRPDRQVTEDVAHFRVAGAPCGRIWVQPRWDGGARACESAAQSGKVYATVSHGDGKVGCMRVVDRTPPPEPPEPPEPSGRPAEPP